jgi:hypothetical protein
MLTMYKQCFNMYTTLTDATVLITINMNNLPCKLCPFQLIIFFNSFQLHEPNK